MVTRTVTVTIPVITLADIDVDVDDGVDEPGVVDKLSMDIKSAVFVAATRLTELQPGVGDGHVPGGLRYRFRPATGIKHSVPVIGETAQLIVQLLRPWLVVAGTGRRNTAENQAIQNTILVAIEDAFRAAQNAVEPLPIEIVGGAR